MMKITPFVIVWTLVPALWNWCFPVVGAIQTCDCSSPQVLSYQETPGVCADVRDTGCSGPKGNFGNPNDLVNCFIAPYTPFQLTKVQFWLGDTRSPLPDTLSMRVWRGTVTGGPSTMILNQSVTDFVAGQNNVTLTSPLTIDDNQFCAGVYSGPSNDSVRLQTEDSLGEVSFIKAPAKGCGLDSFTTLRTIELNNTFCIEATVKQA